MWAPRGVPGPGCYRGRGGGSLGLPSSPPGYSLPPIDLFPVVHFRTPPTRGTEGPRVPGGRRQFCPVPRFPLCVGAGSPVFRVTGTEAWIVLAVVGTSGLPRVRCLGCSVLVRSKNRRVETSWYAVSKVCRCILCARLSMIELVSLKVEESISRKSL